MVVFIHIDHYQIGWLIGMLMFRKTASELQKSFLRNKSKERRGWRQKGIEKWVDLKESQSLWKLVGGYQGFHLQASNPARLLMTKNHFLWPFAVWWSVWNELVNPSPIHNGLVASSHKPPWKSTLIGLSPWNSQKWNCPWMDVFFCPPRSFISPLPTPTTTSSRSDFAFK